MYPEVKAFIARFDAAGDDAVKPARRGATPPPLMPPASCATDAASLAERIDAALPQTQCTRCGYPDCRRYAEAIAAGEAPINRCPPGGAEGIARLAAITGLSPLPLDPACGVEAARAVALIDETWCIGCTLCIAACPVDCIVGASKRMHTVIEAQCTAASCVCRYALWIASRWFRPATNAPAGPPGAPGKHRPRRRAIAFRTLRLAREAAEHDQRLADRTAQRRAAGKPTASA